MVKKKESEYGIDWLQSTLDRIESEYGPVLQERFYVIEHTPAYNTGGYYDQDVPAENHIVSPYFETEAAAQSWMDEHVPDKGKSLFIRKEQMQERTRVTREWRPDYQFNRRMADGKNL